MLPTRLTALCLTAALCACGGTQTETPSQPEKPAAAPTSEASAFPAAPSENTAAASWKTAAEFRAPNGLRYLYVVIDPPATRDDLIAVAGDIHRKEPDAWLFLLDAEEKIPEMLAANRSGDMSSFPAEWVKQHLSGSTSLMLMPDGKRRWAVFEGQSRSEPIAELPCIEGQGMCTD